MNLEQSLPLREKVSLARIGKMLTQLAQVVGGIELAPVLSDVNLEVLARLALQGKK